MNSARGVVVSGDSGIAEAARCLSEGGLVALPTETVYGLAAKASDPRACAAIFEAKRRPLDDPLILHIPGPEWLERLAVPNGLALSLARAFWPGPLTLVLPRTERVPDIVTAGQSTVAIRMSAHPVFARVLDLLGEPVAAPSANRFGRVSPTEASHVVEELGDRIPLVLDGGPCTHGIESTIVEVAPEGLRILRRGPVTGAMLAPFGPALTGSAPPVTPGSQTSHYAPATPLVMEDRPAPRGKRCGLLAWDLPLPGFAAVEILTPSGNPREAAANLYSAIRRLDALGLDLLAACTPPPGDLADAIAERLAKAAARR